MGTTEAGEEKQGGKCCGSCCDFRRAVIVLSIIGIVYWVIILILGLTGVGVGIARAGQFSELDDDAANIAATVSSLVALGAGILTAIAVVNMIFFIFQLVGALKYNMCMLVTCLVVNLIQLVYNVVTGFTNPSTMPDGTESLAFTIISAIINLIIYILLFIYPLGMLIKEIKGGIMSEATYPREAYSCCCEPQV